MGFLDRIFGSPPDKRHEAAPASRSSSVTKAEQIPEPPTAFDETNAWQEYAPVWDEIRRAEVPVFLTGRAGTGKSTFLRLLRANAAGLRVAVVAPTGVAAQNVQGATIHTFFGFRLGPLHPDDIQYNPSRADVLRALDLLIIDEISMVRADTLDAIDTSLRLHRSSALPFGGVCLLMIGDLSQLPPVVKGAEADRYFTDVYASPFFFSAKALLKSRMTAITLTRVFRQNDPKFLQLLDHLRAGHVSYETCDLLNSRFVDSATVHLAGRPTVLTATNDLADTMNAKELERLPGRTGVFTATITGEATEDESGFPAPRTLEVKAGAKVLMVANDPSGRWVNGTPGTIVGFHDDALTVRMSRGEFRVDRSSWPVVDYEYDRLNRRLVEVERGFFTQFPCRLGWAVTVHKSQGMTLDAVDIDLGQGAFAHGQAYVAFSRCRTWRGIGIRTRVRPTDVIVDPRVRAFFEMAGAGGAIDLSALEKMERTRVEADRVHPHTDEAHRSLRDVVSDAMRERRRVELSYMDAKGELTRRVVEPLAWTTPTMFEAFCLKAGDNRKFKIDRVTGWRSVR